MICEKPFARDAAEGRTRARRRRSGRHRPPARAASSAGMPARPCWPEAVQGGAGRGAPDGHRPPPRAASRRPGGRGPVLVGRRRPGRRLDGGPRVPDHRPGPRARSASSTGERLPPPRRRSGDDRRRRLPRPLHHAVGCGGCAPEHVGRLGSADHHHPGGGLGRDGLDRRGRVDGEGGRPHRYPHPSRARVPADRVRHLPFPTDW